MTKDLTWEDPKVGSIIAIPNNTSVVINIGLSDGYEIGDSFTIYEPGPDVFDPTKNKVIGRYDYIKENVKITEVYENFSICKNKVTVKRTPAFGASMSSLLEGKTETSFKQLNVTDSEIVEWKIKHSEILINDPIKIN